MAASSITFCANLRYKGAMRTYLLPLTAMMLGLGACAPDTEDCGKGDTSLPIGFELASAKTAEAKATIPEVMDVSSLELVKPEH